jgi:hypothetical protein
VTGGFCCYPAMAGDRWLEPLRKAGAFASLMRQAKAGHTHARDAFDRASGPIVLDLSRYTGPAPTRHREGNREAGARPRGQKT